MQRCAFVRIVLRMEEPLWCSACGDALGIYEPLVAIDGGRGRVTSLAREPNAASGPETLVHRMCAIEGRAAGAGLSAAAAAELGH
jgi:hypothetical protein